MTTAKFLEASVNVNNNSPSQYSTYLDDLHPQTYNDTPRFKPFTLVFVYIRILTLTQYEVSKIAHRETRTSKISSKKESVIQK